MAKPCRKVRGKTRLEMPARFLAGVHGAVELTGGHQVDRFSAGKEPDLRPRRPPPRAQQFEQLWREHDAIPLPLALLLERAKAQVKRQGRRPIDAEKEAAIRAGLPAVKVGIVKLAAAHGVAWGPCSGSRRRWPGEGRFGASCFCGPLSLRGNPEGFWLPLF